MSNILEKFSGFDKAAILLHILGDSLAMTLFKTISDSDMLKLRIRSRELQNITPSVKKAVMELYNFKMTKCMLIMLAIRMYFQSD